MEIHERVHVENLRPRAVAYNKRVMESRSLTTQIHWSNLNPIKNIIYERLQNLQRQELARQLISE